MPFPRAAADVLAELGRAERMYDGPIPADLRAHILSGGRAQLAKLPIERARERVRHCIAQVRLAEPARPGREWRAALAREWLAAARRAYRAEQARLRGRRRIPPPAQAAE